MGRQANPEPRTFVSGRTKGDKTVWQAGIRRAYNERLYLGTFPSQEQAKAAADQKLKTGHLNPKDFGAITVGRPRKAPKPRQKRPTPKMAPRQPKPIKASGTPSPTHARPLPALDREARLNTLRRIASYRACY